MTDTYDSELLDDGGQWLPQAATAHATVEGRAGTADNAVDALYANLAAYWPGWHLNSDITVRRTVIGYFASAEITKQINP